jgi:D-alanyl-lipoteichoic acid acyltransferase DltB (MBOAT superfamily)
VLFTEFEFILLFLPAVVFGEAILRSARGKTRLLLLASIVFYAARDPHFLPLILVSVAGNYLLGRAIHRARDGRRRVLVLGLLFNLIPLAFCKYGVFLLETFGVAVRGTHAEALFPGQIPLGISFYTFQQLAYLVDVYRHGLVERDAEKYSFFTLFFPQLIAGPIVHHQDIIPQIGGRVDRAALFFSGLVYFLIGYVKKFFLADGLGAVVDPIYAGTGPIAFQAAAEATLGYTFQLYFDFSGYSDMAMGLGMLFGFRLPVNFDSPYRARSVTEFWRRWHITLSRFLRDYLYIPLGGNRGGPLLRYRNLMLTMLLGGLWHGAGWAFVLWGGAHGLLLAVERFFRDRFPRATLGALGYPLTFTLVALLWVPFRAESLQGTMMVYRGLLDFRGFAPGASAWLILLAAVLVLGPSSHVITRWCDRIGESVRRYPYEMRRRAFAYVAASHVLVALGAWAFYAGDLDRRVYRIVPIRTTVDGIDNTRGDFRTNLRQQEVLYGDERKVVIVGSSFTRGMGCFRFEKDGLAYKSGTLGIGGNNVVNALRSATAVLDEAGLDAIVVGVSPLNLGPVRGECAFEGQGMLGVNAMGFDLQRRPYAEVTPVEVQPRDLLAFPVASRGERYRQIHGFLYNLGSALDPDPAEVRDLDLGERDRFLDTLRTAVLDPAAAAVPVGDPENGGDARFHWEHRGILESIRAGGDFHRAMRSLQRETERRGVRLVVYDTPTPDHGQAPQIYPPGFLERYRSEMRARMRDLGIEYHDLTGLFPWSGRFMSDFVHPRPEVRPVLHRLLIHRLYGESR